MENILRVYEKAIDIIKKCNSKGGLFASAGKNGYDMVWSRDSMISMIGASFVPDKRTKQEFERIFRKSLITLAKNQSKLGQIPNAVDKFSKRKSHVDFQTIDSSLWFLIGHYIYKKNYNKKLFNKYKKNIEKALLWLRYQDAEEDSLLEQLPTTDWQDAFPHKYGHVINTQAIYYKTLNLVGKKKRAEKLKKLVNKSRDVGLWDSAKGFYLAYRWKNHNDYQEIGEWFDTLGNLLAIIFDLTNKQQANKILNYIKKKKLNNPYPAKAIFPPIKKSSKYWMDYFNDCDARNPNSYLNGGIWPFIGSFYVLSLIKLKKFREAEQELNKLAESNLRGNFPEWIHPKTKKSYGKLQAWNAGTYILAYESLKKRRCLI
jgi:hypothetical protein